MFSPGNTVVSKGRGRGRRSARALVAFSALSAILIGTALALPPASLPPKLGSAVSPLEEWETVVLTPRQLPELNGSISRNLRLFAYRGEYEVIPFQLDEIDQFGDYVLPSGPAAQPRHSRFVGTDELVFFRRSLGSRAPVEAGGPCPGTHGLELPIGRARTGAPLGWVYLASCPEGSPRADDDFVRYQWKSDSVETRDYHVGYSAALPMVPNRLEFVSPTGALGGNLLNTIYVSGQVQLLGGMLRISRALEDFHAQVAAWSDGPVRLIRRSPARVRTIGDHSTNPGTFSVDSVLQPGQLRFDIQLKTTHDLSFYLHDLILTVALDFKDFNNMRLRLPVREMTAVIDGRSSPAEKKMAEQDSPWIHAAGPAGSFVGLLSYRSDLPITKRVYFQDEPGGPVRLGYRLSNLQRISRGQTRFRVEILNMGTEPFETVQKVLETRARPLQRLAAPTNRSEQGTSSGG